MHYCKTHGTQMHAPCPECAVEGVAPKPQPSAARLITDAMAAMERAGASPALTDATFALAKAREHVSALEREAQSIVGLLVKVGEQTGWRDGDETDRVYSWGEFANLRRLLSEDQHLGR